MLHGSHIIKSFDKDLKKVNNCLIDLSLLLIEELQIILNYFSSQDDKLLSQINDLEAKINATNQRALDLSLKIFTLRSPVASDLRYVFGAIHIAKSLERNGDFVKKAMKDIHGIQIKDPELDELIILMLDKNINMHNIVLNAFIKLDTCLANIAKLNDNEIDQAYSKLCTLVLQKIQDEPGKLNIYYSYMFLGKRLESIADHAYSIKNLISYIETGNFTEE